MRYRHTGNVHKDFHLATQTTIEYVMETYGRAFLDELFERTARLVYRDIYRSLEAGDFEPLLEHWSYYYRREAGEYRIDRVSGGADFVVLDCPAIRHLTEGGRSHSESFYLQFETLCRGYSHGTPFDITYHLTGPRGYVYRIRVRE